MVLETLGLWDLKDSQDQRVILEHQVIRGQQVFLEMLASLDHLGQVELPEPKEVLVLKAILDLQGLLEIQDFKVQQVNQGLLVSQVMRVM